MTVKASWIKILQIDPIKMFDNPVSGKIYNEVPDTLFFYKIQTIRLVI